MSLPSNQLDAFLMVAMELSFSTAAKKLHITQSALSQRIQGLEEMLGAQLFIRTSKSVKITELGLELQRYCKMKGALEGEFMERLSARGDSKLAGNVRIAASSSHMRSVIFSALAALARKHPSVHFQFITRPVPQLAQLLARGEVDFIMTDHKVTTAGTRNELIGQERFVMIESIRFDQRNLGLIGTEPGDPTLVLFMENQSSSKRLPTIERTYMGDVYGIIDGVELGYGRSVVSEHMVQKSKKVRIDASFKTLSTPVYLSFLESPYYTRLQSVILEELKASAGSYFKKQTKDR